MHDTRELDCRKKAYAKKSKEVWKEEAIKKEALKEEEGLKEEEISKFNSSVVFLLIEVRTFNMITSTA